MVKKIFTIPNCITFLRIIGTAALLFLEPFSAVFYVVYTVSGFTDVLDGFIARTTKTVTRLGSKLDSAADLMFYAMMLIKILPALWAVLPWQIWIVVGAVCAIRIAADTIGAFKFHQFVSLHTILNKLTGFCVFCVPYTFILEIAVPACWVAVSVAAVASVYELILHIRRNKMPN